MLTSITPLGERGRDNRWWLTVTAYVVGSVAAGALTGALAGLVGSLLPLTQTSALAALAAVGALALGADLEIGPLRRPTIHRQVDDRCLDTYLLWVWVLGYGVQLGVGVMTIVTSSTVYVTWAAALLTGSVPGGALIGATFGLARALPVLATRPVTDGRSLRRLLRRTDELARPVHRLALGMEGTVGAVALVSVLVTIGR